MGLFGGLKKRLKDGRFADGLAAAGAALAGDYATVARINEAARARRALHEQARAQQTGPALGESTYPLDLEQAWPRSTTVDVLGDYPEVWDEIRAYAPLGGENRSQAGGAGLEVDVYPEGPWLHGNARTEGGRFEPPTGADESTFYPVSEELAGLTTPIPGSRNENRVDRGRRHQPYAPFHGRNY